MDCHHQMNPSIIDPKIERYRQWQQEVEQLSSNDMDRGSAWRPQLMTLEEIEHEEPLVWLMPQTTG